MRAWRIAACAALCVLLPLAAVSATPGAGAPEYHIQLDKDVATAPEKDGKKGLYVTLHFKVHKGADDAAPIAEDVQKDEILVEEDGKRVEDLEIFQPRALGLTTVLALDAGGSMAGNNKMDAAKKAADAFLGKLDLKFDSGLITFNDRLLERDPPGRDADAFAAHRKALRDKVQAAKPGGGAAYLDATAEAVGMLKGFRGGKAVLCMTDGVDLNSRRKIGEVIRLAKEAQVRVYTIGVGDDRATSVLVLDHSGSMADKANDKDDKTKIESLREAAARFVELMQPGSATTLLPFSSAAERPLPFSDDKAALKRRIQALEPGGGTLLYDATWDGVQTLAASGRPGAKVVVVLTDGFDEAPGSRRSPDDVVAAAKAAGVPLHLLGLGRPGEVNDEVMKKMAEDTGGTYHHAESQQELFDVFQQLSTELHDVDSLRRLAEETGGKYYPVREVSQLSLISEKVSEELQDTWTVTFRSLREKEDGTARGITVSVVRGGVVVSDVASAGYNVHGVVVPELDHRVYLILLAGLGLLLAAPAGVRRLYKLYGGRA
jgi:VWFA-related protein